MFRFSSCAAALYILSICALPVSSAAQTLLLTTKDRFAEFEGTLQSFGNGLITIATSVGPVTIPSDEVTCTGAGCPPELLAAVTSGSPEAPLAPELAATADQPSETIPTAPQVAPELTLVRHSESSDAPVLSVDNPEAMRLIGALVTAYGEDPDAAGGEVLIETRDSDLQIRMASLGEGDWGLEVRAMRANSTGAQASELAVHSQGASPAAALPEGTEAAPLAHDALVIVASATVGIEAISLSDLAKIYAGEISDWSELGGGPGPITAVIEADGSEGRASIEGSIMAPFGLSVANGVVEVPDAAAVARRVGTTPGAIGVTRYAVRGRSRLLGLAGACGLVSNADPFTIRAGEYPLSQQILLRRSPAAEGPALARLLDWMSSAEAERTVASLGYVTPTLERGRGIRRSAQLGRAVAVARQADKVLRDAASDMVATLFGAERLSSTLRLAAEGGVLAPGAEATLERLASELGPDSYASVALVFAGFEPEPADGDIGAAVARSAASANLAMESFAAAHPDLLADDRVTVAAKGFGPASPVVCADVLGTGAGAESAAHLNRRVEVWVARSRPARN